MGDTTNMRWNNTTPTKTLGSVAFATLAPYQQRCDGEHPSLFMAVISVEVPMFCKILSVRKLPTPSKSL